MQGLHNTKQYKVHVSVHGLRLPTSTCIYIIIHIAYKQYVPNSSASFPSLSTVTSLDGPDPFPSPSSSDSSSFSCSAQHKINMHATKVLPMAVYNMLGLRSISSSSLSTIASRT